MADDLSVNADEAVARLLRLLAVEGVTGREKAVAAAVIGELVEAGVPRSRVRFDRAHEKIPLPTETGNLIVTLPGTRPGPRAPASGSSAPLPPLWAATTAPASPAW